MEKDLNKKGLEILKKWEDSGLLSNLNYDVKLKIVNTFELLAKHLSSKTIKITKTTGDIIFVMVRRIFTEDENYAHQIKIYDNFEFDDEKIIELINYVNDCENAYALSKYITNLDVEAEICVFLTRMYVAEQNFKNKLENRRKQEYILEN